LTKFQKSKYGNKLQELLLILISQTSNTHHVYNKILTFLGKPYACFLHVGFLWTWNIAPQHIQCVQLYIFASLCVFGNYQTLAPTNFSFHQYCCILYNGPWSICHYTPPQLLPMVTSQSKPFKSSALILSIHISPLFFWIDNYRRFLVFINICRHQHHHLVRKAWNHRQAMMSEWCSLNNSRHTCTKEKIVFETIQRLERNHVVATQEMHKMKNNTQNEKKNLEQFFVNRELECKV
jgi:hypothetical protein